MKDWKTLLRRLTDPHGWLLALLTLLCTAGLVGIFVKGWAEHPVAYLVYVMSFYCLCIITWRAVDVAPGWYRQLRAMVYANKYGRRYLTDPVFKTHVNLWRSLVINLLYVAINVLSGWLFRSWWFVCLAVYYIILAVMRFLLLRYIHRHPIGESLLGEWKRARLCAAILTLINLALAGAIMMMMYVGRGYEYPGILIYVMAAYTFYITVAAIVRIVTTRKLRSPVMTMATIITLAAALVSLLALETAMLTAFPGEGNTPEFRRIMIAATGAGISAVVLGMSSYMIIRSAKEVERIKEENTHE